MRLVLIVALLLHFVGESKGQSIMTMPRFTPEEQAFINQKDTLVYVVDPNWMPIEIIDETGTHIGIAADFIDLMTQKTLLKFKLLETKTWVESLEKAKERKADLVSLLSETAERKKYLNFTLPIFEVQTVLVTLQNRPLINDINDVGLNPVGIIKGYSDINILKTIHPNIVFRELDSYEHGLEMVQNGDLYGLIGNMATMGYTIQKLKMNNVKIAGKVTDSSVLRFGLRNDEPILIDILNKAILAISDSEKQQIINRWLSVRFEHQRDNKLLFQSLTVAFIILLMVSYFLVRQRRLNKQLNSANAQLGALNKQKNYLMSIIGHDLRNPLMTIIGYSSYIVEEGQGLSEAELVGFATKINAKSEQVLEILNQILEWSRLEMNQIQVHKELVDVHELVEKTVLLYDYMAQEKNIKIMNSIPIATIFETDDKILATIVRNCLHNAIKYSNNDSKIEINFKNENTIQIRDYGIGMSAEQIALVMHQETPFSSNGTQNEIGTGLGILICRELAMHLGATFKIDSEFGKGTEFNLIL